MSTSTSSSSDAYAWPSSSSYSRDGSNHHHQKQQQLIPPPPTTSGVTHETRHARRLYVGGIPSAHSDEEELKEHLNNVINQGLGKEPSDGAYILSIYVNQKRGFAFVELNNIELTTACLQLDGLIYKGGSLKITRANEYKPELVGASSRPPLRLRLPEYLFTDPNAVLASGAAGLKTASAFTGGGGGGGGGGGIPSSSSSSSAEGGGGGGGGSVGANLHAQEAPPVVAHSNPQLDALFQHGTTSIVESGSVAFLGFPYDEERMVVGRLGCASCPQTVRMMMRKFGSGSLTNPELGLDCSSLKLFDVGDVAAELPLDKARSRLMHSIAEVVERGAVPFVIGGSSCQTFSCASGLMMATTACNAKPISVISVNAQLGVKSYDADGKMLCKSPFRQLLEDPRFCFSTPEAQAAGIVVPTCSHRLIKFACQGAFCSVEHTRFIEAYGGRIVWLSRHIRDALPVKGAQGHFQDVLDRLADLILSNESSAIFVSFSLGSIRAADAPGSAKSQITGSLGLSSQEALDICFAAGKDSNVRCIEIIDFDPESDCATTCRLVVDMFYRFCLGFALRKQLQLTPLPPRFVSHPPPGLNATSRFFSPTASSSSLTLIPTGSFYQAQAQLQQPNSSIPLHPYPPRPQQQQQHGL